MIDLSEMKGRKFNFVPAALFGKDHAGLGCYVKWGKPKGFDQQKVVVVNRTPWWLHIHTPDRELLIVKDGYRTNQIRPLDDKWDEFVSWSQFHLTAQSFDDSLYMVNFAQHFIETRDFNFNMAKTMPYGKKREFKYIADSGGFQIFRQKIDFISPTDAAVWYDKNIDLGVAIDIPVVVDNKDLFLRAAHVQKDNTIEMMSVLKQLDSKVEIINVCHGQDFESQVEYMNIVMVPEIRRVALGDMYRNSILVSIDLISRVLYRFKDNYDHFHILGVYNLAMLPAIILMANKYPVKALTSDSSTHLQSGINKMYHHQTLPESPGRRIAIGGKKGEGTRLIGSSHKVLPCSCPVCDVLKYFDIFSMLDGSAMSFTLAQHNLFEITRYVKFMNAMAQDLSRAHYTSLVLNQLSNKASRNEVRHTLDYIYETAAAGSPEKVREKYNMYLGNSLFQPKVSMPVELFNADEGLTDLTLDELITRTDNIIKRYEHHHKAEKQKTSKRKQDKKGKAKKASTMFSKKKRLHSKGLKGEHTALRNKKNSKKKNSKTTQK